MRFSWRNCVERACWRWTTPRSTARTSGLSKGGSHRTFAGRPGPARQQAPPDRRPARDSARRLSDRRKPSRRHPAHAAVGRHTPRSRAERPATPPAPAVVRRSRVRLRQVPASRPRTWDHPQDRPPQHPARLGTGQDTLGRRADLRLAPPVQAPAHPLRDSSRPSPRTTPTRLQHHLLETTPDLILKRSVRGVSGLCRSSVNHLGIRRVRPHEEGTDTPPLWIGSLSLLNLTPATHPATGVTPSVARWGSEVP